MYIRYLVKLMEEGKSFLEETGKGCAGWDYPRQHLAFYETKKVSSFVKFE